MNSRTGRAPSWRAWYKTASWRQRRAEQLAREPFCRFCDAAGLSVLASVADHVEPHRGDWQRFNGPLQSLCSTCHSRSKQRAENAGYDMTVGADGYPIANGHPFNR